MKLRRFPAPLIDSAPLERYGLPERQQIDNPAAGAAFTQAVDGAFYLRLVSVFCRFVADGNAANRDLVVEYLDTAGVRFGLMGSGTVVTAGQTRDVLFSAFQPQVVVLVDNTHLVPLQPIMLGPTDRWRLNASNIQAGDQFSRIRVVREQFYSDVSLVDDSGE